MNIFGQGRDRIASGIASRAIDISQIASQNRAFDIGALGEFTSGQASRLDSLRESIFGGQATIEQLTLARETQRQNQQLIDEAIKGGGSGLGGRFGGAASGAAAGALFGASLGPAAPIGIAGGALFGGLAGFFGG